MLAVMDTDQSQTPSLVAQKAPLVLIVEDDGLLCEALAEKLKLEKFDTLIAENGEVGLTLALQNRPDVILLDLLMPKMDGTTMLEKLREDSWGKNAAVIVLSNVNPEGTESSREALTAHPSYYLVKAQVTLELVVAKIKELLQNTKTN